MIIEWLTSFLEKLLAKKKHEVYKLRWRKAELQCELPVGSSTQQN